MLFELSFVERSCGTHPSIHLGLFQTFIYDCFDFQLFSTLVLYHTTNRTALCEYLTSVYSTSYMIDPKY